MENVGMGIGGEWVSFIKYARRWLAAWLVFCFVPAIFYGRTVPVYRDTTERVLEQVLRMLEGSEMENREEDERHAEMAFEYFKERLEHPLNINRAGRGELEKLLFLSDFQIESLLDYRAEAGEVRSVSELALLNGFDESSARILRSFIVFGPPENGLREGTGKTGRYRVTDFFRDCKSVFFMKGHRILERDDMYAPVSQEEFEKHPDSRYLGTPYYMQLKYKGGWAGKIQWGLTLENDAGERFLPSSGAPVDFCSFHIALTDLSHLTCLIIGDFSARFGQGLTLWNSFHLAADRTPMDLYKRGAPFVPYTSSDENHFFRGVAASYSFGRLDVSMMFSYHGLDARIRDEKYTSIITDGLHNTLGTLETRKTLYEGVGGVTVSYLFEKWKIGSSVAVYGYDRENGREIKEYNRYQMYDGLWGNASFHVYTVLGRVKCFGELAFDAGGNGAVLAGAVFPAGDAWEVGILARNYSKGYIAPHAGAYSTLSACSNQRGILVNSVYRISEHSRVTTVAEGVYYPWVRYNVNEASWVFKCYVKGEYSGRKLNGYVRISESYATCGSANKWGIRLQAAMPLCREITLKMRGEGVFSGGCGGEVALDATYTHTMFRIQLRGACFDCPTWDTRLYLYENDLPYTYSNRLLYGKGWCGYLLVRVKPGRWLNLYVKLETIHYFSGEKDAVSKIKIGTEFKF